MFLMSAGIKAIIFDYGNVLCEPQREQDVQTIAAILKIPRDVMLERYWKDRGAYDRADLDPAGYWTRVAGRPLAAEEVKAVVDLDNKSWTNPRPRTLRWVNEARRNGLRTALLSNLPVPLRDVLENDCPWLPDFDVRTYSCSIRAVKPDRPIYDDCVRALGVRPGEAVFLDDRLENITGAGALGIHGVWFESADSAAKQLSARFGLTFNGGPPH